MAFGPVMAADGFKARLDVPVAEPGIYFGVAYCEEICRFIEMVYECGWVRPLCWSECAGSIYGRRMMEDPAAMASANADDLTYVLTTCIRADRFCDGYVGDASNSGLIARVVARAEAMLHVGAVQAALPKTPLARPNSPELFGRPFRRCRKPALVSVR